MNDLENERTRAEAVEQVPRALRSARRAELWAGLNRYLASEAVRATRVAKAEREAQRKTAAGQSPQRRPGAEEPGD